MPSFRIGGIASGLDTDALIEQLVAAASIPRTLIVAQRTEVTGLQTVYEEISTRLAALNDALEAMDTVTEFGALTGTSNSDAVAVSVDGDGVAGTYAVQVNSLAASEMEVGADTIADDSTIVGESGGTFSVDYGGTTTALTGIDDTTTLSELTELINDQVEGVTAYLINTGSGYRLVVSGDDTGASNTLSLSTNLSALSGGFTEAVSASDASLTVNGVSITDSDNTIDSVIQGVTFELLETTATAARVTVALDEDTIIDRVNTFLDAYNSVISYIGSQSISDPTNGISGPLIGDTTSARLISNLRQTIASQYSSSSIVTALSQIGFSTAQSGALEFDASAFRSGLADNFDDVFAIFTESDGVNASLRTTIDRYIDDTDGIVTNRIESLGERALALTEDISDFDDRMDAYEERLRRQFTSMELAISRLQQSRDTLLALLPTVTTSSST
jgi:flagellar capping protein FliD